MRVFEYGSGASTLYWLDKGAEVVSVEHNPKWYDLVSNHVEESTRADRKLVLAQETNWSNEFDSDQVSDSTMYVSERYSGVHFEDYVRQLDHYPPSSFDIIFVDGVARPSCIAHGADKVKSGGILVLDNSERPRYQLSVRQHLSKFRATEFYGVGPYNRYMWATTVFERLS